MSEVEFQGQGKEIIPKGLDVALIHGSRPRAATIAEEAPIGVRRIRFKLQGFLEVLVVLVVVKVE